MKKTEWFPPEIKPIHVGVYWTRRSTGVEWFSKWDGENWLTDDFSVEGASKSFTKSEYQERHWQGLAEPPHGN